MNVFGHNQWKNYFRGLMKNDALGSGYLFYGSDQLGKRTFARELAKLLGADGPPDCQFFSGGEGFKLEQAQMLRREMSLRPLSAQYKIAVIDHIELASPEAQNALLKLIEEPQDFRVIVAISEDIRRVPETIVSRLSVLPFSPLETSQMEAFLDQYTSLTREDVQLVLELSAGRPGRALELVRTWRENKNVLRSAQEEVDHLKASSYKGRLQFTETLKKKESTDILEGVDRWFMVLRKEFIEDPSLEKAEQLENLASLRSALRRPGANTRLWVDHFLVNFM